jgi:hypothetical protein
MRYAALTPSLLLIAACASAGNATPEMTTGARVSSTEIMGGTGKTSLSLVQEVNPGIRTVPAPINAVWGVLPQVLAELKIPVTTASAESFTLGSEAWRTRREIAGVGMSKIVDCGNTTGEQNADTYQISFTLFTQLKAIDASHTRVSTTVQATGRSMGFSQQVGCTTLGALEDLIARGIEKRVVPQ